MPRCADGFAPRVRRLRRSADQFLERAIWDCLDPTCYPLVRPGSGYGHLHHLERDVLPDPLQHARGREIGPAHLRVGAAHDGRRTVAPHPRRSAPRGAAQYRDWTAAWDGIWLASADCGGTVRSVEWARLHDLLGKRRIPIGHHRCRSYHHRFDLAGDGPAVSPCPREVA